MTTSVTYTFSNATTADATQVNQNFTDVITGLNELEKLTARGDLLTRGASSHTRLALGTAGKLLRSDGTDVAWSWPGVSVAKSADYTITDTDGYAVIYVTTGASTITITLPTVADNTYRAIRIVKVDSGAGKVTIDGEGAETIDGATTLDIVQQYVGVTVWSNGSAWYSDARKTARYVVGDTTGTSCPTGFVGELLSTSRVASALTAMTTNTAQNVTSAGKITLTPGVWLVGGHVGFVSAATTSVTYMDAAVSKTNGTLPAGDTEAVWTSGEFRTHWQQPASVNGGGNVNLSITNGQVIVSSNTDLYLIARAGFTVSTLNVFGSLWAIRIA